MTTSPKAHRWSLFETQCLKQLRAHPLVHDLLLSRPQYTDVVGDRRMLRFLRGQGHDVEKTAEKLKGFLMFRDEKKVDDIRNELLFTPLSSPLQFPHAEKILKATKHDILAPACTDSLGNPLATEYYAFDGAKFVEEVKKEEYLLFMLYCFEYRNLVLEQMSHNKEKENLRRIKERALPRREGETETELDEEETYGVILRINIIRDFSGLSMSNFLRTQTIMTWVLELASNNYPETLERSFIVNAPWFFSTIWLVLSSVLEQRTVDKMKNMGSTFLKDLERDYGIAASAVPQALGGAYTASNVTVRLARPPSPDWQGSDPKVYKGPFGLRKVMKRAGGGTSSSPYASRRKKLGGRAASGTAAAGQKTGGADGKGRGYERKEDSPDAPGATVVEVGSIVLGEDVGDGDSEPEEGELRFFDEENAYVATAPTSRCGCM